MALCMFLGCITGCRPEKKHKDRRDAVEMFTRICRLTKEYTTKIIDTSDSLNWANVCLEYEEKLDKISFNYPPDTDLLLTEGQNDTIHSLMLEYIKVRDERIYEILHPVSELDSLIDSDSIVVPESVELTATDASHSLGN